MTRRLYIHVGPRKTATSTIQRTLANHDNSVVFYPRTGLGLRGPGQAYGHHGLVFGFFGEHQDPQALMESLAAECSGNTKDVVISAEILEGKDIGLFAEAILDRMNVAMEVEILFACREHFSRAASLYNHRTGRLTSQERRLPDEFLTESTAGVCYAPFASELKKTGFPITALDYHPSSDWVQRFLTYIGFQSAHMPAINSRLVAFGPKMLVVNLALKEIQSRERRKTLKRAFRKLPDRRVPAGSIFGATAAELAEREFAADRHFVKDKFGIDLVPPLPGAFGEGLRIDADDLAEIADVAKDFGADGETIVEFAQRFCQQPVAVKTVHTTDVSPIPVPAASEPVRLVVWDLDETFWRGTLAEGGISQYVQEHHDAVIELARRGILSSICSRNDPDQVLPILEDRRILEYFVFPSISWESKGNRLAALIETVQLRPASVMFIDDNPANLAEARARMPDIQVAGVDFIARMLADPRFRGKKDPQLTRLAQYKLLAARKRDEAHSGDNCEFLRSCDIRVYIEHDVVSHLDRAIELINRTNQLNFTKDRLPEDLQSARAELARQCAGSHRQAGLVRVVDRYGDYGFVGFYLMRNRRVDPQPGLANQTLLHYCFSCRALGMFVEHWLYHHLHCPALDVVGEVLTDLNEARTIDWIRLVPSISEHTINTPRVAAEIRVFGGCEANPVAHYLGAHCHKVAVTGNFQAGALFVRLNSCFLLLSSVNHAGNAFEEEMARLGIPAALMGSNYFRDAPEESVFVFSGSMDAFGGAHRVRHRRYGWEIDVSRGNTANFVSASEETIARLVARAKPGASREQLEIATRHIRENYEIVGGNWKNSPLQSSMEELVRRVPQGGKLVLLLDDERRRSKINGLRIKRERVRYNAWVRQFFEQFPFAGVVEFSDAIQSENEILTGGNHYERMVYWRAAERIVAVVRQLTPKAGTKRRRTLDRKSSLVESA